MGNGFAYAVLATWPLFAVYLYRTRSMQVATLWVILGGFMLLPVKTFIDFPLVPPLGKHSIPVISALIGCWFIKNKRISYINELGKIKYLVILFIAVPFITTGLNSNAINVGGRFLPGVTYYDGLSGSVNQFFIIVPFFIGRQFFRTYQHQLLMFKTLVIAGLFYSTPMLFEVRMSPQLHTWIYGYFPHSFGQQFRFGGFRPVVFMGHGLLVSLFAVVVLLASVTLYTAKVKERSFSSPVVGYYLLIVLLLCKSIAAILYGAFAWAAIKNITPKVQHKMAMALVCLALSYPILSIMNVFPHQTLVNIAESFSLERAQSLGFRFDNETVLLERGKERFFFGWGGWGRNRVYDDTGKDLSTTDGKWVITFGQYGTLGFIAEFGLLGISVFRAKKAAKLLRSKPEQVLLAAHALLVGIIMIDQIPNASLQPWLWLLVGVLLGRSENIISESKKSLSDSFVVKGT